MGSPEAESTGAGREGETAAGPRPKKARRGGRAPHPLPNQRKASGGRTERIGGLLRTEGGGRTEKPRGVTSSEGVRRVRVWCLLAPSRGGAPLLGETWSAD